jgi:hypothetical protein
VDQGRRLKGLAWRQPAGEGGGQAAQLRVHDRQQFRRGLQERLGTLASRIGHVTAPPEPSSEKRQKS